MTIVAGKFYRLKIQALGSRLKVFVGGAPEPVVDVEDRHFTGMIGVRDYCDDGNQSFSSFSNLAASELVKTGNQTSEAPPPPSGGH